MSGEEVEHSVFSFRIAYHSREERLQNVTDEKICQIISENSKMYVHKFVSLWPKIFNSHFISADALHSVMV